MPPLPKPEKTALVRRRERAKKRRADQRESNVVRQRSNGRCECVVAHFRCRHAATEVHHMIGGWRTRGADPSADLKQHLCNRCHRMITEHKLSRVGEGTPHYTDTYKRSP